MSQFLSKSSVKSSNGISATSAFLESKCPMVCMDIAPVTKDSGEPTGPHLYVSHPVHAVRAPSALQVGNAIRSGETRKCLGAQRCAAATIARRFTRSRTWEDACDVTCDTQPPPSRGSTSRCTSRKTRAPLDRRPRQRDGPSRSGAPTMPAVRLGRIRDGRSMTTQRKSARITIPRRGRQRQLSGRA